MLPFGAWLVLVLGGVTVVVPAISDVSGGRLSVDVALGDGRHTGGGGFYRDDPHLSTDATIAWRVNASRGFAPAASVTVGWQGYSPGTNVVCHPSPVGGCLDHFPDYAHVAVVAGGDLRGRAGDSHGVPRRPRAFCAGKRGRTWSS
ncbi:MAG: hypothetical protein V4550_14065 [Gemmatimonadota bacterium]